MGTDTIPALRVGDRKLYATRLPTRVRDSLVLEDESTNTVTVLCTFRGDRERRMFEEFLDGAFDAPDASCKNRKHVCINGVMVVMPAGAVAYKYADAVEGACWLYTEANVSDIEKIDASLIERQVNDV